jgi:hypothetical protein
MPFIAPPHRPFVVSFEDQGDTNRRRLRIWQFALTLATVLATTWFIMQGPIPGIIALAFAKHILVAILVMGLGVDAEQADELRSSHKGFGNREES